MSGLDKIKSQILDEANRTAKNRLNEAEEKAKEMIAQAKKESEAESARILQKSQEEIENYAQRIDSSCDMQRRQAMLRAKQEVISDVMDKAYKKVLSLNDTEYFDLIRKVLEKNVQPESGIIYFSERDSQRMPESFADEIGEIAEAHGGKLDIAEEPGAIDGGFVLKYGGIEENCTIRAMFDAKRDELSDMVQKVLF